MRIIPAISLALALLFSACATRQAPTGGPEVAVLSIQIKKDKELRRVVIAVDESAAPLTSANFQELVRTGFYDGMRFHRAFPNRLVQTGDPFSRRGDSDRSGTGGPGYTVPAEIRLPAVRGAVVASRLPDNINPTRASNGSQFFVALEPMPQFDGKYTVFGSVIEGLDVLDEISQMPTNSNDFPLDRIVIRSIRMEPRTVVSATGLAE